MFAIPYKHFCYVLPSRVAPGAWKKRRRVPLGTLLAPLFSPLAPIGPQGRFLVPFSLHFGLLLAPFFPLLGSFWLPFPPCCPPEGPKTTQWPHQPTNPSTQPSFYQVAPCPGPAECAKRLNPPPPACRGESVWNGPRSLKISIRQAPRILPGTTSNADIPIKSQSKIASKIQIRKSHKNLPTN